jgi:hypothetical protein
MRRMLASHRRLPKSSQGLTAQHTAFWQKGVQNRTTVPSHPKWLGTAA